MILLTKQLNFMTTIGDVMGKDLINKVITESKRYGCDIKLLHNGVEHTITQFTNAEELSKNWVN